MAYQYNIVVIGGGAAGLVSAYIAAAVKAKVALIEQDKMGGDCLNYGCVPSKSIIRTARFINDLKRHQQFGIDQIQYQFDFEKIMNRVHQIIKRIEPHDSIERYTELGIDCFPGKAEIIDRHKIKINDQVLTTKNIILALGAGPFIPPIKGLDKIKYRTSENLWEMKKLPKRMVILGGGPIGCEMAQTFARLGSQVTQIDMLPRLLNKEDDDVAQLIQKQFQKENIHFIGNTKATEIIKEHNETILIAEQKDQGILKVSFDEILLAVGRTPRTKNIDWHKLAIELNQNGTIKVDEYLCANKKNIYACGDVISPYQFTHTAAHQAWYCAVNALFSPVKRFKVDYRVIPWCTFTDPEIAQVGLNEMTAKRQGISYEVTKYELEDLDRAITEGEDHGFVKVLTKPGTDKILGATIVAHNGGELITEFIHAMKQNFGLNAILATIHPYPTLSEANKYAAGQWKKQHAPTWALNILEKFHTFRR